MTQTFEEWLEDNEFEMINCEDCAFPPLYNSEGVYLCKICAMKRYVYEK